MKNKVLNIVIDAVEVVAIALVISFIVTKFILLPVEVTGTSMEPLLSKNDRGFSSILGDSTNIDRFDIVVIDNGTKLLVKRVVGLPNEEIEFKNKVLYINGKEIPEPFLNKNAYTKDFKTTTGDNEYFCLGDNRFVSIDSRQEGNYKREKILSKHIFVIYPFNKFGYIK